MSTHQDIAATIIAMERAALDRWGKGDPAGFIEISAPDVVYFDPFIARRIDGRDALAAYYTPYQIYFDRYELLNPHVQVCDEMAVLTFNYVSWTGERESRWNCTEVYRHDAEGWRIIQTHWSFTEGGKS